MDKVLILANNDIGLYKFRKELIEDLVKKYEVYISLPNGDFVPKLEALGAKFIETPLSRRGRNPLEDIKLLVRYRKIIKRISPKVVLTYTIKPNVYGGLACQLLGVPYLTNITGLGTAVENDTLLRKITLFLYKISLRKSKCVYFQNEYNKKVFRKNKILKSNSKIIPGSGVNLEYYKFLEYPAKNKIEFLFIARIMKEKGIEEYLSAAEYIKNKYPNTEFHILGYCEQDYKSKINALHEQGIVRYHGMQSDVRKFHSVSHCTIHPTYYPEGMSNVLLESAACGRPAITTNRPGCKEIVDDGYNGYLVNEKDTNDLIVKIEKFINLSVERRKQMSLASRKKVEIEFDRNIVVKSYLKEIKKITQ